ncbi:MAG: acyl-CoA/acyl-ACP dehydrogenase [Clostridia bacterium]|nr:acyl-CoA/acyl-ACP dehydrogenase [Clostridia bacterium]
MDFELTEAQKMFQQSVRQFMTRFPAEYWREHDRTGDWPDEFYKGVAEQGWLGVMMPEEYGGAGLGLMEASILMEEIAASGACASGSSAIHMNIFGVNPVVKYGSEAMKRRYLPEIIAGRLKSAFAVTEPNVGLETPRIQTRAEWRNGRWVINGQKVWISTAQEADRMLIITRTTPYDQVEKKTQGMTLFYAPIDRSRVVVREIEKCGRAAVDSNELFINDLEVSDEDRVGEVGRGFYYLLDGINPERILIAHEEIGIGRVALERAVQYAKERVVFGRPIGKNQGIQFALADSYAKLEAALLLARKAAWLYDHGLPCGAEANMAKYLAAEFATEATSRAMVTHGGFGYAKEYDVERYWREAQLFKIVPVTPHLALAYVGEHVLGLPKSY